MDISELESAQEIDRIVRVVLQQSGAAGILPTPVDRIMEFSKLTLDSGLDLSKIRDDYHTSKLDILKRAIEKVIGLTIPKKKIIFIDCSVLPVRQTFVKLHETGHNLLPWQKRMYELFEDDELNLDPFIRDLYEAEASYFASDVLFQLDLFQNKAKRLPLKIATPISLAKEFGSSIHAALRRYVEFSNKKCALLVIDLPGIKNFEIKTKKFLTSTPFAEKYGQIQMPETISPEWAFFEDIIKGTNIKEDGRIIPFEGCPFSSEFHYHFFNNKYNAFVLFFPPNERVISIFDFKIKAKNSE